MEEDNARVSDSVQGESSHPSTRGDAQSSGDAKGVGRDTPNLGDGSSFFDEDTVPPHVSLTDEEWQGQERERIRDMHEQAMIEDKLKVFREEVDLTIDHGPLSDSEIYSLRAFLAYLFGEFLFVDRSKGRAHLSVVWATRHLYYLERLAWGPVIMGWLHYHLCGVAKGARYLGGCAMFFQTPIMVSIIDEDAYLIEMVPWIEEWRSRAAQVIDEEEGICLSQYEDRYKDNLRDIATLTDHGERMMWELRASYLDEG
ncbi:hypothetical protein AMTR_s00004p00260860 [Amborella trichopoda]|uniref:Aminotransferase-like plant mobile domain-containing protein n=1 Tax=Amborella trichopoda TaxID=13333 RepID=W1NED2_AMBTC|nr:hypothetical protein AMTR_s00004p00260860 [Amborella trichopoda]